MKSKWKQVLAAAAVSVLVTACGGGGGGSGDDASPLPTAEGADKYVGTWVMSCSQSGVAESEAETLTLSKTSATQLNVTVDFKTYTASTNCTGVSVPEHYTGTVTLDGPTTATYQGQATAFDKMTANITDVGSLKWIGTVLSDGKMVIDFEDNGADSSTTYPSNPNEGQTVYTKQ
jgi:hypothetical protein